MTSTTPVPEHPGSLILKTDSRGRVRTPTERREALLEEFEKSGLSGAKFAALAGIRYSTFAAWLQRKRRQEGKGAKVSAKSVQWLEAVVEQAQQVGNQNASGVVLELPGGARVQMGSAQQVDLVAALLRALAKSC